MRDKNDHSFETASVLHGHAGHGKLPGKGTKATSDCTPCGHWLASGLATVNAATKQPCSVKSSIGCSPSGEALSATPTALQRERQGVICRIALFCQSLSRCMQGPYGLYAVFAQDWLSVDSHRPRTEVPIWAPIICDPIASRHTLTKS